MSQVTVTTTDTTPPVRAVGSGALLITMTAMLAPTSVGQIAVGLHDAILLPLLIPRDTMRGFAGFTTVPQQQPQSLMPSWAYANYAMGTPKIIFSFKVEPPNNFSCHVLASVMVFTFCSQVPMCLSCSPMEAQLLGSATSAGIYTSW